ncbi:MAG: cytochrome C, partial [Pseudomonadota bacterium]
MSILCSLFAFALSSCDVPLQGDVVFEKRCAACHSVMDGDVTVLAGRGAQAGPNLYAIPGAAVARVDGYPYSRALQGLGQTGATWDADNFTAFLANPNAYVRDALDDPSARSKMAYR